MRFAQRGLHHRVDRASGPRRGDRNAGRSARAAPSWCRTPGDVDRLNPPDPERMAYLTQTTLSLDETRDIVARLKERFPAIVGPPAQDICYATENRQLAVKAAAPLCDVLLVVGSQNSSNSKRLVEVSKNSGVPAYLVDDSSQVDAAWIADARTVALTAGASAPENLVEDLIAYLSSRGFRPAGRNGPQGRGRAVHLAAATGARRRAADVHHHAMTPGVHIAETLADQAAEAAPARRRLPAEHPGPAWLLAGGADRRYDARGGLHPAGAVAAPAGERRVEPAHAGQDRQGGAVDPGAAASGRRIQHLPGRARRTSAPP